MHQGPRRICGERNFRCLLKVGCQRDGLGPLPPPPPPLIECISRGPLPVIRKVTTTSIKHLLPRHKHENIHVPSSFHFYNHTSWCKVLPFKWVPRETLRWRRLLSTTTYALAIATLAPTHTQWMLSLSSHTARHANTWCRPTSNAGAPPSPWWYPNGGPRPHTSVRGAISSGG